MSDHDDEHMPGVGDDVPMRAEVALGAAASAEGGHEEDEAEEEAGEAPEGLFQSLRHKLLHVGSMSLPLRLFTGLAIGQLAAVALLVALHPWMGASIAVGTHDYQTVQIPLVVFVTAVIFLWAGWSLLLAGALAGHWILRAPILVAFTIIQVQIPALPASIVARNILLALVWGWALAVTLVPWAVRFAGSRLHPRLVAALRRVESAFGYTWTMLVLAAGIGAYFLVTLAAVNWGRGNMLFPEHIGFQIEALTLFAAPVLFLAGSDFVELSETVSTQAVSLVRGVRAPWLLVALPTVFAFGIVVYNVLGGGSPGGVFVSLLSQMVLAAVVLAVLVAVVRWAGVGKWRLSLVPFLALLLVTGGVMAGEQAYTAYRVTQQGQPSLLGPDDYSIYRDATGHPAFSLAYPRTWTPLTPSGGATTGLESIIFNGTKSTYPGVMEVMIASSAFAKPGDVVAGATTSFCQDGKCTGKPHTTTQGAWQITTITKKSLVQELWVRTEGKETVAVLFQTTLFWDQMLTGSFRGIATSTRLDLNAAIPPTFAPLDPVADARALSLALALPGVLGVLVGFGLLARFRRQGGRWAMAGLFAMVFGVLILAFELQTVAQAFALPSAHLGFTLPSVQLAVALGTLVIVGGLVVRRGLSWRRWTAGDRELLAMLLALAVGIQLVLWFISLFNASMAVTFSVAQAVILIVGMTWDLLMSGEQITNVNGRAFPRHARVLLYLGYMVLVATAVLVASTQTYAAPGHGVVEPFFDDDAGPQQGLIMLGVPLLLTGFVLEASRWWRQWRERTAQTHPQEAALAVVSPSGGEPEPHVGTDAPGL